jgi:L-ascorbate metabolism protein UlaG (beta-lactamase superfamily)
MKLSMIGHAAFWIQEPISIVMDPFDSSVSTYFPDITADVVTESHQHYDHCAHNRVKGNFRLYRSVDFVQIQGVAIQGFQSFHDKELGRKRGKNLIFRFTFPDGLTVLHSGDLGHLLDEKTITEIGTIDILLIPVGGTYTLDASEAFQMVNTLHPTITIPMHYRDILGSRSLAPLEDFTRLFGHAVERKDILVATKEALAKEDKKCITLTPLIQKE